MNTKKNVTSATIVTPRGRLSYPSLLERKTTGDYPSDLYETTFLIAKTEDISKLTEVATKTLKDYFGDKYASIDDLKNPPIRDGDEKGGEYTNHWYIKAKSDNRPAIVGRDPKITIDNAEEIYGGQNAKLSLTCYSYNKAGNAGVAWSLRNVQILGNGEAFGPGAGRPEDQFVVEGDITTSSDGLPDGF